MANVSGAKVNAPHTLFYSKRCPHSKNFLEKGKKINRNDLVFKRPGTGISPMDVNKIIGRRVKKNIKANWNKM